MSARAHASAARRWLQDRYDEYATRHDLPVVMVDGEELREFYLDWKDELAELANAISLTGEARRAELEARIAWLDGLIAAWHLLPLGEEESYDGP